MCGIVGYVGTRTAKELLLHGLERLEYRGYDSAGIALLEDEGLEHVRAVVESGRPLAQLAAELHKLPQAKTNVPVHSKEISPSLRREIDDLAGRGRVVVRASGTEPVMRVLAEAETEKAASALCARIAALVSRELGS